jgi:hypothetical protein
LLKITKEKKINDCFDNNNKKKGKNLVSASSIQREDLNDSDFFKILRQPFRLVRLALSFF